MPLKIELATDPARGPGWGLLTLVGPGLPQGRVEVSIERNQGAARWLGHDDWSNQSVWHAIDLAGPSDGAGEACLPPALVDPIATQGANVMLLMHVRWEGGADKGRLMLRNLLSSLARGNGPETAPQPEPAPPPPPPPEPEPQPEPEPGPGPEPEPEPEPLPMPEPPAPPANGKGKMIAAAALMGILIAGAAGYVLMTQGDEAAPETPMAQTQTPPAPQASSPGITDRPSLAAWLQGTHTPEEMRDTAKELFGARKGELGMLLLQQAAQRGDMEAGMELARLYDPETWSPETSPMPQADAETAAYWYEGPANGGNVEAQYRLGALMVGLDPDGFQGETGRDWLRRAAEAGNAKAAEALKALDGEKPR